MLSNVLDLIEKVNNAGIKVGLENDELLLFTENKQEVDAGLLEEIRFNKTSLLAYLRQMSSSDNRALARQSKRIFKGLGKQPIPLSFAQERLWFIHKLQGSLAYHLPWCFRLEGALNADALELAFREVIRRHEVLRTVITEEAGVGYQEIRGEGWWRMNRLDEKEILLQGHSVESFISQQIRQPYDLASDWMLKAWLIRRSAKDFTMLVMLHHIAFDGWSMPILVKEVLALYRSFRAGQDPELPSPPLQYADYALWERTYLKAGVLRQMLDYWINRLKNAPALDMPTDYPRPREQSLKGKECTSMIGHVSRDRLMELCHAEKVTPFMTLLALFKVLLYRYSGTQDICVGTPVAGRVQPELEELIGFFVNTLVLRTNIDGSESFRSVLQQVRRVALEAYEHQELSFAKVVEALEPERDMSRSAVFQVMFAYQDRPGTEELDLDGVKLTLAEADLVLSKLDISMTVKNTARGLALRVRYSSDLFAEATVERMLGHYANLLEAVLGDKTLSVGKLQMLGSGERETILSSTTSVVDHPASRTMVDLLDEQVGRSPDAIAVLDEKDKLTYQQLADRSDKLAAWLRARGVVAETPVALLIDRSVEVIVALIGILKAGGAYVPLDVSLPRERLAFILDDIDAKLIITTSTHRKTLLAMDRAELELISLDENGENIFGSSLPLVTDRPTPGSLAYIIYTSGSTGQPKGVMIEHEALVDHLYGFMQAARLRDCASFAMFSPISADMGHSIIYSAFLAGAALHVLSAELLLDGPGLLNYFQNNQIDCIKIVPSLWLSYSDGDKLLLARKKMIFGGEALAPGVHHQLKISGYQGEVYNHYGPTETTIGRCIHRVNLDREYTNIPIGRPFSNTNIYVVGRDGELVPYGIAGELHIGGRGVARGYWKRPELTADRFVSDLWGRTGQKLYKTGDIVRLLPTGDIEYLHRIDFQVKIRGYRVEPAEIEYEMQRISGVKEAVVVADSGSGRTEPRLIAHAVIDDTLDKEALLRRLRDRLPVYMVPAFIRVWPAMPLNVNGKIDRKKLSAHDTFTGTQTQQTAPSSDLELKLTAIWEELLNVSLIGINDNFFELGGHSLLATRVISAIRKDLAIDAEVRDLFFHPTVGELAAHLQATKKSRYFTTITSQARTTRIPLSFAQERLWFIDKLQGSVPYHMQYLFRLEGPLDVKALENAFRDLLLRHEALRCVIHEEDGRAWQEIIDGILWKMDYVEASSFGNGESPDRYIDECFNRPFDLSADYMLRVGLIRLAPETYKAVVVIHHIASDGWSSRVLINDLSELYRAHQAGERPRLSPLLLQYPDYAIWQRQYLDGPRFDEQLSYWKAKLNGVQPLLLPTDLPRPKSQSTKGDVIRRRIASGLAERLRQLSQDEGTTLFMTLMSGFTVLLHRYSGQDDICVGTSIANRTQKDVEGLIGFFVNALALRYDLGNNPSFRDLLQQVKNTLLEAYTYQDVPFEKVVENVSDKRAFSGNPLFQVMFVLQNTPDAPDLQLGNVNLRAEQHVKITSKFDITFVLREVQDHLDLYVEYCADLFSRETISRMLEHYEQILQSAAGDRMARIGTLQMLTNTEESELRDLLSGGQLTADDTVVDLLEKWTGEIPLLPAVLTGEQILSFADLNSRCNQLAHYLIDRGVKKELPVAVLLGPSPCIPIAMLAIMKAGGCYVPVDPANPQDRIQALIRDCGARWVITNEDRSGQLPTDVECIHIDRWQEWSAGQPDGNPVRMAGPDSLAYIIYTSGSSGAPKGVMIEHRSLSSYLLNCRDRYIDGQAGEEPASISQLNYTFDASMTSFLLPLISGRPMVVGSDNPADMFDAAFFPKHIAYDFLKLTPAHLSLLAGCVDGPGRAGSFRKLVLGGEALHEKQCRFLADKGWDVEIVNEYGPTEAAVGCSVYAFSTAGNLDFPADGIPIGKALGNVRFYIVDKYGNPVPRGVPGELYIGGIQVARGYHRRPDLTAEKFIPFNVGDGQTERVYKTGDKVRLMPDGNLLYAGRTDDQVKIRGYRIEPAEIEQAIDRLEETAGSCVVAKKNQQQPARLAAYYIPQWQGLRNLEEASYARRLDNWKQLYDMQYEDTARAPTEDPEFDITGWNDSFSEAPIAAPEMKEWLEDIVQVIFSGEVRDVLEIGCGSGLIYYQLAGKVERYTGVDISFSSVNGIRKRINEARREYGKTRLQVGAAHQVAIDSDETIDTVIINSVIQYFPGESYLTSILERCISILNGKGRIIIGDVRDKRLLPAFKARLLLGKLESLVNVKDFEWMRDQAVLIEEELNVDPEYFLRLKNIFPEISHVDLRWKQGQSINELTLYRYTAILYIGGEEKISDPGWQTWTRTGGKETILDSMAASNPVIAIKDAPNYRLWKEKELESYLKKNPMTTMAGFRETTSPQQREGSGIEEIIEEAIQRGYTARLLVHEDPFQMNLLLELEPCKIFMPPGYRQKDTKSTDLGVLTNMPLFAEMQEPLQREIRETLQSSLPAYMIPQEFYACSRFPLTGNGKVDRKYLACREARVQPEADSDHLPGTPVEKELTAIWQELLQVEKVGIHDNFFELGGHSIIMVQMLSRIRKLEFDMSLNDLFNYPTIKAQADLVSTRKIGDKDARQPGEQAHAHMILLRPGETSAPIFITPGAKGVSDSYDMLSRHLTTGEAVFGIQMQGALQEESPLTSVADIAARQIQWIREVQPNGPYKLIGHSFGGFVVYEMARQLEAAGEQVAFVAILDVEAESRKVIPPTEEGRVALIMRVAAIVFQRYGIIKQPYPTWVYELEAGLRGLDTIEAMKEHFIRYASNKLTGAKRTAAFVLQLFNLQVTNAIMNRKIVSDKLKTELIFVKAADEKAWAFFEDDTLDWNKYFSKVHLLVVPGNHQNMVDLNPELIGKLVSEKILYIANQ